jgi:xanthine dehydrogenase accessory factor
VALPTSTIPLDASPERLTVLVAALLERGLAVSVATVVGRKGSAPSTPGQKLAMWRDDTATHVLGTVGGGAVERAVLMELAAVLDEARTEAKVHTFRLGPSLGMCCGGSADVLIEPLAVRRRVLLVGAGHVGLATAPLLRSLDFDVTLVDGRDEAHAAERLAAVAASGVRVLHSDHDDPEVLSALGPPPRAALVVATHDHSLDQDVIAWGLARGLGWVGGVGSRRKALRTRERLLARGFATADATRVRMPVGVPIGARRPGEIAVSIAAELVAWRADLEHLATRGATEDRPASPPLPVHPDRDPPS